MIGHLGARVSDLLDGRLPPPEEERAWDHVHTCHHCRDLVEREGWVKHRLAGLGFAAGPVPSGLKGSLLDPATLAGGFTPGERYLTPERPRLRAGVLAASGGAVGMAVVGLVTLVAAPSSAPALERRTPTQVRDSGPAPAEIGTTLTRPGAGRSAPVGRLSDIQATMVW